MGVGVYDSYRALQEGESNSAVPVQVMCTVISFQWLRNCVCLVCFEVAIIKMYLEYPFSSLF